MTLNQFVQYENLFRDSGFRQTQRDIIQPQNWIRPVNSIYEVQRVFLHQDGSFRAYFADGRLAGHGQAAWELKSFI